jgi:hypothetical protein
MYKSEIVARSLWTNLVVLFTSNLLVARIQSEVVAGKYQRIIQHPRDMPVHCIRTMLQETFMPTVNAQLRGNASVHDIIHLYRTRHSIRLSARRGLQLCDCRVDYLRLGALGGGGRSGKAPPPPEVAPDEVDVVLLLLLVVLLPLPPKRSNESRPGPAVDEGLLALAFPRPGIEMVNVCPSLSE